MAMACLHFYLLTRAAAAAATIATLIRVFISVHVYKHDKQLGT
jgi:hypothetical protein